MTTLYQLQPGHGRDILWIFIRSHLAFSWELSVIGIPYQPVWLKLSIWYPSNGSSPVCQFKLSSPAMQVHSRDILKLCCRGLCGPWYPQGRQFGWGLKSKKCIGQRPKTTHFFLAVYQLGGNPVKFGHAVKFRHDHLYPVWRSAAPWDTQKEPFFCHKFCSFWSISVHNHTQLNRIVWETAKLVQPPVGTPYVQGSTLSWMFGIDCIYRVSVCSMCVLV